MEFREVLRRRHMTRNFDGRRVPPDVLHRVIDAGLRAPSAGFSQGWAFVVLEGADTAIYWDSTQGDADVRPGGRFAGIRKAPVLILPLADKQAYLDRYAEPDKAAAGLQDESRWPVPYWDVDTGFAVMAMLLSATDEGLGALFFGIFRGERVLLDRLGVPTRLRPIGVLALGYAAPTDHRSPSLTRGWKARESVVRFGRWD